MKIITNLDKTKDHLARLRHFFAISEKVILASPFLVPDFCKLLDKVNSDSLKEIHLITTLKPKSTDQIRKVKAFKTFIEWPRIAQGKVKFQISINNRLHGKVYIFRNQKKDVGAIITSANLTESGLSLNHEWGVEITDSKLILEMKNSLFDTLEVHKITKQKIIELLKITETYLKKNPDSQSSDIDLDLTNQLKYDFKYIHNKTSTKFWLKPIGVTENPVETSREFTSKYYDLHFSKIRPSGVKPNDLVICYGVGTTKILSIYRATSSPNLVSDEQIQREDWYSRWPWYIKSINMTPYYGNKWSKYDLTISKLASDYQEQTNNEILLHNGSKSLGGLNWGKDKLQLSSSFASYIVERVYELNE